MDLSDTEQSMRDSLRRWLEDHVDVGLQARADLPPTAPPWHALAQDLGLLGAGLPESAGGLGGGLRAHLLVLQTLGEALSAEPYLSSALVGGTALQGAASPWAQALLSRLIDGQAQLGWAHLEPGSRGDVHDVDCALLRDGAGWRLQGRKSGVVGADRATHVLVTARLGDGSGEDLSGGVGGAAAPAAAGELTLVCVDAASPGLRRRDLRTLDGGSASELQFSGVGVADAARLGGADLIEHLLDLATLGACAEALGVTRRLLDDTLDHARTRQQFGMPIAGFQVLQHRLADMHMARLQAQALTAAVAAGFDAATPAERAMAVSSVKVAVGRACRAVGQGAVQLHGAMGVTEELAAGRWFRRATQIELLFGSTAHHLRRVDAALNVAAVLP